MQCEYLNICFTNKVGNFSADQLSANQNSNYKCCCQLIEQNFNGFSTCNLNFLLFLKKNVNLFIVRVFGPQGKPSNIIFTFFFVKDATV